MQTRVLLSILSLFLLLFTTSRSLQAQSETISVGPGYASEVYYDMEDGVVQTAPLNEWDIAFQIQGFASSIITNGGTGVRLYVAENNTVDDFGTAIDTTGMAETWTAWYNSAETWELGAFNLNSDYESGNFGWGAYNMVTHTVAGTTLYVIVLPDGTAKQIMVDGLTSGTYSFSYADLDGSNKVTASLAKSGFAGKNFGYYSIRDGKEVDHEPQGENWDLVFGKYIAWISAGPGETVPYVVTGVRSNMGVTVAEVESVNPEMEPTPSETAFSDTITVIGHDWKSFNGSGYTVRDAVYFVKDQVGDIYRLHFTEFAGSANGNIAFTKQKMGVSSVEENGLRTASFGIYPNVVERGNSFNVVLSVDRPISGAHFRLFDAAGREVYSATPGTSVGLRQIPVNADLPSGAYTATLDVDGRRMSSKVIVR